MAIIQPFRGLRYTEKAGAIDTLTCPPYDVISDQQREEFLFSNPYNIVRLELPKGERAYDQAEWTLNNWMQQGILAQDVNPSLYVYEEEFSVRGNHYKLKGLICRVRLEDFDNGVILPHEETLSKAKQDRFDLMQATSCNFSQIYSLYNDPEQAVSAHLERISSGEPVYCFTDKDKVTHRLWISDNPLDAKAIGRLFADKKLYIADGHHRYETALRYRDYLWEIGVNTDPSHDSNYVMMMLVDLENSGLVVLPTHRIIRDLEQFDLERMLKKISPLFRVQPFDSMEHARQELEQDYRQGKISFVLYTTEETYLLTLKDPSVLAEYFPEASKAYRELDVAVLHKLILENVLGIDKANMAAQINLTYTRSASEAAHSVDVGDANCAFLLNPTKVSEIRDVAAAGEKMPQKSTYFYPKLITGFVMNRIEKTKKEKI